MRKYERILEVIKQMNDLEIVLLWNEYARNTNNYDDEILTSEEFEELVSNSGEGVLYWMNRMFFGHDEWDENSSANPNRNFFYFNGYGNIISLDYVTNKYSDSYFLGPIDIDNLIDYIIDNNDSLYNDDIAEALEEFEEVEQDIIEKIGIELSEQESQEIKDLVNIHFSSRF